MSSPKRTFYLDASIMSHSGCDRYVYFKSVLGKSADAKPLNDTEFGSAWHIFRERLALTKNMMESCGAAMKYWKMRESQGMIIKEKKEHLNPDYLMYLFQKYHDECGVDKSWGKYEVLIHPVTGLPMVEQTFSIKFYEDEYIVVYLQGTMDEWNKVGGFLCIGDDKTSSMWDSKGHLASFEMKIQGMFYILAIRLLSELPGGDWFKEAREKFRIGFRINGVYLKTNKEKTEFIQSNPRFYEDEELDELQTYLTSFCTKLSWNVRGNTLPPRTGIFTDQCNGKFGHKCEFFNACKNFKHTKRILECMPDKKYEPLMFRK